MIFEVIFTILIGVILKAILASNWLKENQLIYSKPGIFFVPKRFLIRLLAKLCLWFKEKKVVAHTDHDVNNVEGCGDSPFRFTHQSNHNTLLYFNGFAEEECNVIDDAVLVLKVFMTSQKQTLIHLFLQVPGSGLLQLPEQPNGLFCVASKNGKTFTAEGVSLEILEDNQRWRISYRGIMRLVDPMLDPHAWQESKNTAYVRFSFQWCAYSSQFNFSRDTHVNLVSDAIAREIFNCGLYGKIKSFMKEHKYLEQWGRLRGRVFVDGMVGGKEGTLLTLRGVRGRYTKTNTFPNWRRYLRVTAHTQSGVSLSVAIVSYTDFLSHVATGYVVLPNQKLLPVHGCDLRLWRHGEDGGIPDVIQFNVHCAEGSFNVSCLVKVKPVSYCNYDCFSLINDCFADVFVDSIPGRGVVEFYYRKTEEVKYTKPEILKGDLTKCLSTNHHLTLTLSDPQCTCQEAVGYKASLLASLSSTMTDISPAQINIPSGFCITVNAYQKHLEENPEVQESLSQLLNALKKGSNEKILVEAQKCAASFVSSNLSSTLISQIKENIAMVKKRSSSAVELAVRCSATVGAYEEEDFLPCFKNITCLNQVLRAVLQCWSNQFTYELLQSRRRRGIPVHHGMGVIVQEMVVEERVSGELSSSHPGSGDPTQITIKPNKEKYDTHSEYFILKKYNDGSLDLFRARDEEASIRTRHASTDAMKKKHKLLLSEDDLMRLCKVTEAVKKALKHDIKSTWSVTPRGKIFILAVKKLHVDITEPESDLFHEFDTAHARDDCMLLPCKHHDILLDVVTPLTNSTILKSIKLGLQKAERRITGCEILRHSDVAVNTVKGRTFLNSQDVLSSYGYRYFFNDEPFKSLSVDDEPQDENAASRLFQNVYFALKLTMKCFLSNTARAKEMSGDDDFDFNSKSAPEIYKHLSGHVIPKLSDCIEDHVILSARHQLLHKIFRFVLCSGAIEEFEGMYASDVATVYQGITSECENIPEFLSKIALALQEEKEEFLSLKPLKAVAWLSSSENKSKHLYDDFLNKHGHQCLNQCEIREESWLDDQSKMITAIQMLVEKFLATSPNSSVTVDSILDDMKTPLNVLQSSALKFIIPRLRTSFYQSITSKNQFSKIVHRVKQGYWKLAQLLEEELKLPDEDLLFFLTHYEIGSLIEDFSPSLIGRALRRRHVFAHQHSSPAATPSGDSQCEAELKGECVCSKPGQGPARIIGNESEAFLIQAGDVLVVERPDIGWAPYFPLLAGFLAEEKFIFSAGAVAARDYGVPCIVGLKNARKLLNPGEIVSLDGSKGIVKRAKVQ